MQKYTKSWMIDTAERVTKTFVQGFLMAWIVFQDKTWDAFWNVENLQAGIVGGAIALAMAVIGGQIGSQKTAAWLPEGPDTEAGQVRQSTGLLIALVVSVVLLVLIFAKVFGIID